MPLLQIKNLTHWFGGLRAVHNFHENLEEGEIVGLIGPNGAGKTTIFNLICGIYKPTQGEIIFDGENLVGLPPHVITSKGIGRTFQKLRLWRHLSVLDTIKLAHFSRKNYGLFDALFWTRRCQKQEEEIEERTWELLKIFGLTQYAYARAWDLPYGLQRKVEMVRALVSEPKLLLLDEPTVGMTLREMYETMDLIREMKEKFNLTILIIEHRMKVIMNLCERIKAIDFGEIIADGTPDEIRNNPRVIEAYLGKEVEV
ncbi:MAG TPA: ABC transporter ATP-binding protein [Chloroflexi bacterium]|nr:ABC transporter ATP-binding protein [Chloroflexota bacterium]